MVRSLPPDGYEVVFTGSFDVEDVVRAARDLAERDVGRRARDVLVDASAAAFAQPDVDELAWLAAEMRSAYPRGRDLRYLFVASPAAPGVIDDYRRVRSAMAQTGSEGSPLLQVFTSRDDALEAINGAAVAAVWHLERDEHDGVIVTWRGPFDMDEFLATGTAFQAEDPEMKAPYIIQDFRAMTIDAVALSTLHRIAVGLGTRNPRPSWFRSAVVATGEVADAIEQFRDVRDLASGRAEEMRPAMEVFADYDDAAAWARGGL